MFAGKTIFITGASSGLGRALAIELSKQGALLLLMARNRIELQETRNLCVANTGKSHNYLSICTDVTNAADCKNAIKQGIEHFAKLDYLLLNAGVSMWSTFENLENLSILKNLMDVNYHGAINCVHPALPYLKAANGMIVVISSIQGKIAVPFHSGYVASKYALHGFFDVLRTEINRQIDILLVSPTWIQGTNLKENAYTNHKEIDKSMLNKHKNKALPLDYCVGRITQAMLKRKRELILPSAYRLLPWFQLLCPTFLNFLIKKRLGEKKISVNL